MFCGKSLRPVYVNPAEFTYWWPLQLMLTTTDLDQPWALMQLVSERMSKNAYWGMPHKLPSAALEM